MSAKILSHVSDSGAVVEGAYAFPVWSESLVDFESFKLFDLIILEVPEIELYMDSVREFVRRVILNDWSKVYSERRECWLSARLSEFNKSVLNRLFSNSDCNSSSITLPASEEQSSLCGGSRKSEIRPFQSPLFASHMQYI